MTRAARRTALLLPFALAACSPAAPPTEETAASGAHEHPLIDLARAELVDLTHPFDERTIYWPTSPSTFRLERLAHGETPGGWFYSANALCTPEHGGTHLDAPVHFAADGQATDRVPLDRLVAPAVVLDVIRQAAADPDYRLALADVEAWEREHGPVPAGAIVLLRTGWAERWPDRRAYLGDDTPGDASKLHFPSYGLDAARHLIERRRVAALGVDTASIDPGASRDFPVHRLAGAADVPGFENLARLDRLPPTGAWVIALPMKIANGSGGPLRAIALVPKAT